MGRGKATLGGIVAALLLAAACGSDDDPEEGQATPPAAPDDVAPAFTRLDEIQVPLDGGTVPLADSPLRYERRGVAVFDDPETAGHDGISAAVQKFLSCETDEWSIGGHSFTIGAVATGVVEGDRSLVERGLVGFDWGVERRLGDDGVHSLHRSCDDSTVENFGGTHHTTQWLETLGRAVLLVRSSPWAADFEGRTDTYVDRVEEIARRLVDEENYEHWQRRWMVDDEGNVFTHKTYMRAAGLGLAALLTDDEEEAAEWRAAAAEIARRGMAAQRDDGVNPERGGHDVSYQMVGVWYAAVYYTTIGPGPLKDELGATIDRALEWMSARVDDRTGQIDITGSTRVCSHTDANLPLDTANGVRAHLLWGLERERPELIERAARIDEGARVHGNPCPEAPEAG